MYPKKKNAIFYIEVQHTENAGVSTELLLFVLFSDQAFISNHCKCSNDLKDKFVHTDDDSDDHNNDYDNHTDTLVIIIQ